MMLMSADTHLKHVLEEYEKTKWQKQAKTSVFRLPIGAWSLKSSPLTSDVLVDMSGRSEPWMSESSAAEGSLSRALHFLPRWSPDKPLDFSLGGMDEHFNNFSIICITVQDQTKEITYMLEKLWQDETYCSLWGICSTGKRGTQEFSWRKVLGAG